MGDNVNRLVVTGMGLVTSLGLDAQSSVAAIRSGIANFTQHETVMVNGDRYGTRLRGATIARIPECLLGRSMHGADRVAALLVPAIQNCIEGIPHDLLKSAEWQVPNAPVFTLINMYDLLKKSGSPVLGPTINSIEDGIQDDRCSFFQSIAQATEDLRKGKSSVVIVVSLDSLCDDGSLQYLCDHGRLKSGTNPEGIIVGETAGVVMLESELHALSRNGKVLAYLSGFGKGRELRPCTGQDASTATGLRKAFAEAFASLPGKGEEIDMVIADLNGERARAKEWAYTEPRIFPRGGKVRNLLHPADCTGDCGTGMGGVLLAAALDHLSTTSSLRHIALATSDDSGTRAVLCVQRYHPKTSSNEVPRKAAPVVPAVIEQHIDDASFLWDVRKRLVESSQTRFQDLVRHDQRLYGNLVGIRHAGDAGWEMVKAVFPKGDAGDFFTAAFAAFRTSSPDRIEYLLEKGASERNFGKAAASALGWIPYEVAEPHIKRLLSSDFWWHRYIGISACAIHRRDPGATLTKAAFDASVPVRARAVRAYGELGRNEKTDLLTLQKYLSDDYDELRFSASWSATLAGNPEAVHMLKSFVRPKFSWAEKALMAVTCRTSASAPWLHELAQEQDTIRFTVTGLGMTGDPTAVPWLLEQMRNPSLARLAGEAFAMITGVDITSAEMEALRPGGFRGGPTEDPMDGNVAPDPDQELPWPDPDAMTAWWKVNKGSYAVGIRHLAGKPVTENHLRDVLGIGAMKDRALAALLLAMKTPGHNLIEVRTPCI